MTSGPAITTQIPADVETVAPADERELAEVLAGATAAGRRVAIWGGGTHRAMGHESEADLVVSTAGLTGIEDWERHVTLDPRFARPSDAPELVGDSTRAREVLGWSPTVPFEEVVARMVEHDLALVDGA